MTKGRRTIPAEDRALFWQSINSGADLREACRIAGVHYQTGLAWRSRARMAAAQSEAARVEMGEAHKKTKGKKVRDELIRQTVEGENLPPVVPLGRLSERAQRGLEDFDFFRRVYLGRVPSPWQVDAAYKIVQK